MSKHTPEPWRWSFGRDTIQADRQGRTTDVLKALLPEWHNARPSEGAEEILANIQRIVACVNACAGMENPVEEIERLRNRIKEQEAQP
jgi:hypothetical protein